MIAFVINLIKTLKYIGVFVGTFVEGPTVGMVTGMLIRLGYLNLWLSYLLYVVGDFTADCLYYSLGYNNKTRFLKKFNFFLKDLKLAGKTKNLFCNHPSKVIVLGKLTHFLGLPILIGAGLSHYPWKKFLILDLAATLIKSAIIISMGYYLTFLWIRINNMINYVGLITTFLIIIVFMYLVVRVSIRRRDYE